MTTTASYYHCSKQAIARGQGRSAVAAAAYRTGTCIENEREHSVVDYSRKHGVVASWTIAPEGAPAWATDAAQLWNAVEAKETRKNSQLAHEITLALPAVLNDAQREGIMERFADAMCDRYDCALTVAIHEPSAGGDDRNHHAHVMLTTRRIGVDGWGTKIRELNSLPQVSEEVAYIRELSADLINDALTDAGHDERVDHRSFKTRGIDQVPTTHLGPRVTGAERQGFSTERGEINRAIIEERLLWQMEQAEPEITPAIAREMSQRWDDWQPLQHGADVIETAEASTLAPGTPADTSEEHTGWRRFVDRVRAFDFKARAMEFLHDETSGAPEAERGFAARLFDAGRKLVEGWHQHNGRELTEGLDEAAALAAEAGEGARPSATGAPEKTFADRVRERAAALLHNERGCVPYDDFDQMAEQWAQAPPHDEGPLAPGAPEPDHPEPDGPDIE